MPNNPILARLRANAEVAAAIAAVSTARAALAAKHDELAPLLFPEQVAAGVLELMRGETDSAKLADLRARYSELQGPAAALAKQRAEDMVNALQYPIRDAISNLLAVVDRVIEDLRSEVIVGETAMFNNWNLPRETTSLTKRVEAVAQTVAEFRKALQPTATLQALIPTSFGKNVADFFGAQA